MSYMLCDMHVMVMSCGKGLVFVVLRGYKLQQFMFLIVNIFVAIFTTVNCL